MSDPHPDLASLEALRTGEASPAEAAHVDSCSECRTALDGLKTLAGRLEGLPRPRIEVPAAVRAAIHARAARTLRPFPWRWVPAAAAAALLVGLLGLWTSVSSRPIPGDVDGNGGVDIVDAYTLAVSIREGRADAGFDVTGDGTVDRDDVDEIARLSVSLGGGGGQ